MTVPDHCPDRATWRQAVLAESSLDEQATLAAHLESCAACRQTVAALAGGEHSWEEMAQRLGTPQSMEPGLERVLASLGKEPHRQAGDATDDDADQPEPLSFLTPSSRPDSIGRLGNYEIQEVIGRGGFGIVLKAYDDVLLRIVAIKVLAPTVATSGAARKRFIREAQAAAAVTHENIVAIHGVDSSEGLPFIVMQYVAGQSLQERIDCQGPLSPIEAVRIGMQTAAGLAAAHAQGLVHRDIKPANILLENGIERVRLSDFGLARTVDDASVTQTGVIAGTPQYMAPEQAKGGPIDARTDLFSLGSVLYAVCAGRPPFRAPSSMAVLQRVCHESPRPLREINADIPIWLAAIIDKLLAKDPDDRYQSAREVATLFGEHLSQMQQPGPQQAKSPVVTRSSREHAYFPTVFAAHAWLHERLQNRGTTRRAGIVALAIGFGFLVGFVAKSSWDGPADDGWPDYLDSSFDRQAFDQMLPTTTVPADPSADGQGSGGNIPSNAFRDSASYASNPSYGPVLNPLDTTFGTPASYPSDPTRTPRIIVSPPDGGKPQQYDSLAEAVAAAPARSTIEIAGDGPFITKPIQIIDKPLIITAAKNSHPVIMFAPDSEVTDEPLLNTNAALRLVGLAFVDDRPQGDAVSRLVVSAKGPGNFLQIDGCRFAAKAECVAVTAKESPRCQVQGTVFVGLFMPCAIDYQAPPSDGELTAWCCLFAGPQVGMKVTPSRQGGATIKNVSNSVIDRGDWVPYATLIELAATDRSATAPRLQFDTTANLLCENTGLLKFHRATNDQTFTESQQALQRLATWREVLNQYPAKTMFLSSYFEAPLPDHTITSSLAWNRLWSLSAHETPRVSLHASNELIQRIVDSPANVTAAEACFDVLESASELTGATAIGPDMLNPGVYQPGLGKADSYFNVLWNRDSDAAFANVPAPDRVIPTDSGVNAIAFADNGDRLLSGGDDGVLRVWDWRAGQQVDQAQAHEGGVKLIVAAGDSILTADMYHSDVEPKAGSKRQGWTLAPITPIDLFPGINDQPRGLNAMALSPDGKYAAAAGGIYARTDVEDGATKTTLSLGSLSDATGLEFARDGKILYETYSAGLVRWDVETGQVIDTVEWKKWESYAKNGPGWPVPQETLGVPRRSEWPDSLTVSGDGAIAGCLLQLGSVHLWDLRDPASSTVLQGEQNAMASLAISPDSTLLATAGGIFSGPIPDSELKPADEPGRVLLWDLKTKHRVADFRVRDRAILCVRFSPDGRTLATAGVDGKIKLFDVASLLQK